MEYGHGGEILKAAKRASLSPETVIDFSVSVNPNPLPEKAQAAITEAVQGIGAYPDPDHTELKGALADHFGLKAENILPGNGSTELIYLIAQAASLNRLPGPSGTKKPRGPANTLPVTAPVKRALIVEPAFSEYRRALDTNNFSVSSHTLSNNFRLDTQRLLKEVLQEKTDLLFIANPANPTGALADKERMLGLARGLEGGNTLLVLDEAFIDFVPRESIIREMANLKNTILLRSMTKFYSMAGLRLGFIAADCDIVERIRSVQPPWSVNSVAMAATKAIIEESAYAEETLLWLKTERAALTKELGAIDGLKVFPAAANYIMVEITVPGVSAFELQERLLRTEGILIRNLANFNGLNGQFFRVAVKEAAKNRLLASALKGVLKPTAL